MGIIEEGREALAAIDKKHAEAMRDERIEAISGIVGNVGTNGLEFTGDVEAALVHNMGGRAISDGEATAPYLDLAERIEAEQAKDQDKKVPVLMILGERGEGDERYGATSFFVNMPKGPVQFRSGSTREEGVTMHAFGGKSVEDEHTREIAWEPDTETVTHSRLALVGMRLKVAGNILTATRPLAIDHEIHDEVVLKESHVADNNRGGGMPSDYAFTNYEVDRLDGRSIYTDKPEILVGWEEIESAFISSLGLRGKELVGIQKVREFFSAATGSEEMIKEYAPKIAAIIEAADRLQDAVDGPDSKAA